jgi:hypothetical protein
MSQNNIAVYKIGIQGRQVNEHKKLKLNRKKQPPESKEQPPAATHIIQH